MHLFKTSYNKDYYNSFNEKRPFQNTEIANKIRLITNFKQKGELFEVGCGQGQLLYALQTYFTVSGIDISKYCVEKTNQLFKKDVSICMDIEKSHLTRKYDVAIAFDVLEHLHNPEKTIQNILASLKPGGIFIFSVPNNFGFIGYFATKIFNFIDKTHINTLKRSKWIKIIDSTKLDYQVLDQIWFSFAKNWWAKYLSFDLVIVVEKPEKSIV